MTVLQNIAIEIKKKSACEISQALFFFISIEIFQPDQPDQS